MIPRVNIYSPKPQKSVELPRQADYLAVSVKGYDNTICVRSEAFRSDIRIFGCNNTIIVEPDCLSYRTSLICIGDKETPCFGCTIHIGRGGTYDGLDLRIFDRDGRIHIGEGCLMSWNVMIWGSDTHALFDAEHRLRRGRSIEIGNRVWVGHGCHIGKNTHIADGCVVGWGSVVSGRFEEPNCVLAGNPARVVRRGISWDRKRPDDFILERVEDMQRYADWAEEAPPPPPRRSQTIRALVKLALLWCLSRFPGSGKMRIPQRLGQAKRDLACLLEKG